MSDWSKSINRYQLLEDLQKRGYGNGHDLPLDLEVTIDYFPCYRQDRKTLVGQLLLRIARSNGRRHRIFVLCPKCGSLVPFGRYHQHWGRKDHG